MSDSSDHSSLSSSMTDLMTSLAVIFILLLVASLNNAQQEGVGMRNQMVVKLQDAFKEFEAHGVRVESDPRDPLSLLVLVPEGLLQFQFDRAEIQPKGIEFLRQFAPRLSDVACSQQFRNEINSIIVEGHADSQGTDKANLERSQQRSSAVELESLNVLSSQTEGASSAGTRECLRGLISATGRGSEDPVIDPTTGNEDKDKSRRVVFKIRIRSIEQREIREVIGGLRATGTSR